ncbi:MAG: CBS domain-containing protein [Phycisphaerales bacterium]|nr:CBS domain-containing protein [Planctomycetota bacterium]MCH8509832.1 CBS domain-containing protein [Phycisphaerales bacterium]
MGTVQDILSRKPQTVLAVDSNESVLEAAKVMNDHKIGSVVVMNAGRMAGILTERDILTRVVASQRPPAETRVEEVMTREVLTCRPGTKLNEARHVMRERRIRHLPVVEKDLVVGMISLGDLNNAEHEILVETIQTMESYIAGGSASLI